MNKTRPIIEVEHPVLGRGRILCTRHNGLQLFVEFTSLKKRWLRREDLRFLGQPQSQRSTPVNITKPVPSTTVGPTASPGPLGPAQTVPTSQSTHSARFSARQTIEALRMGVVPLDRIQSLTFGREKEIGILEHWLNDTDDNVMFLIGEYGTGKTHFLEYIRARALSEGFAVAQVTIDPVASPFYKPKRVWSKLAHSFKWVSKPSGAGDLGDLRSFLISCFGHHDFRSHRFFHEVRQAVNESVVWDWIFGDTWCSPTLRQSGTSGLYYGRTLPTLHNFQNAANEYTYLLSALGWGSQHLLGLRGLLLIFDEAESIDQHSNARQWNLSRNTALALMRMAANDATLGDTAESSELCDLDRCRMGAPVPFIYQYPTCIKTVFAFTESYDSDEEVTRLELSPLPHRALEKVWKRIQDEYAQAYGTTIVLDNPEQLIERINGGPSTTRMLVKACVEALDLLRFNPNATLHTLLE